MDTARMAMPSLEVRMAQNVGGRVLNERSFSGPCSNFEQPGHVHHHPAVWGGKSSIKEFAVRVSTMGCFGKLGCKEFIST